MSRRELNADEITHLLTIAHRIAYRWTKCALDADDAAQEAIILYLRNPTLPDKPVAWLSVVVRRLCAREKKRALTRREAEMSYGARRPASVRLDIDTRLDIHTAMAQLSGRDRRLLTLVAKGVVSRDIAIQFGCQTRDVGQMIARARRRAKKLAGWNDEDT